MFFLCDDPKSLKRFSIPFVVIAATVLYLSARHQLAFSSTAALQEFSALKTPPRAHVLEFDSKLSSAKPLAMADFSGFVFSEGILYGAPREGWVGAFELETKKWIWWSPVASKLSAPIELSENGKFLILGTVGGRILKINKVDGTRVWDYLAASYYTGSILQHAGKLFVWTAGQQMYALNENTGKPVWSQDVGSPSSMVSSNRASPVLYQGRVIVGMADGTVFGFSPETGTRIIVSQEKNLEGRFHDLMAPVVVEGGRLILAFNDGRIRCVEQLPQSGEVSSKLCWKADVEDISTVAHQGNGLYFGTVKGHLIRLNLSSGKEEWDTEALGTPVSILPGEKVLYYSSSTGWVGSLSASDGKIQWLDNLNASVISRLQLYAGRFLMLSTGQKNVYAYALDTSAAGSFFKYKSPR